MISADRIPCCIPFCRRTAARSKHPESEEIICGKHWRCIPIETRRHRRTLSRRFKRLEHAILQTQDWARQERLSKSLARLHALWARNWETCKRLALELGGHL